MADSVDRYDVVVVGGGAAGLSGAIALARFSRSVLVIDAGEPRNAPAGHVHNFLTRDGTPPAQLYALGRAELARYGGTVVPGRVGAVRPADDGFTVDYRDTTVHARGVLVAIGGRDVLPDISGLAARWGRDVLHCPYCHGYEVRDQRIGVVLTSPIGVHQVLMFRQLSPHVTALRQGDIALSEEQLDELAGLDVPVVDGPVESVEVAEDRLTGVRLASGVSVELDALVVATQVVVDVDFLAPVGLKAVEFRIGDTVVATHLEADQAGATQLPRLWIAGNVADPAAQVVSSAATGMRAAAGLNAELINADAADAAQRYREEQRHGPQAWEERYRSSTHRHVWSGRPNAALVDEVATLAPGTALDAGAGEGGDAIWLAEQGWRVTAVDVSPTALARGQEHAAERGVTVTPLERDLSRDPAPGQFELVTSFFLHVPRARRAPLLEHLGAAVAPGGTLLLVGHDPSDTHTTMHRPDLAALGWTAPEVAAALGPGWTIEVAEARPRPAVDQDGRDVTVHDAVLRARRDG